MKYCLQKKRIQNLDFFQNVLSCINMFLNLSFLSRYYLQRLFVCLFAFAIGEKGAADGTPGGETAQD